MLINLRNAMMSGKRTPTAKDYVQDGLIAMWDGIENAGWGVHLPTTTWKDLSENAADMNISTLSSGWWEDDGYVFNGDYAFYNSSLDTNFMKTAVTCEAVYVVASGFGVNYRGLFGARNLSSKNNNYFCGLNYYTGAGGWNFGGIADTYPNAVQLSRYSSFSSGVTVGRKNSYSISLDRSSNKIYCVLNGGAATAEVTGANNYWSNSTHGWMLGMAFGNGRTIDGYNGTNRTAKAKLLCHRIYNRILIASERAANYSIDKARFGLP